MKVFKENIPKTKSSYPTLRTYFIQLSWILKWFITRWMNVMKKGG